MRQFIQFGVEMARRSRAKIRDVIRRLSRAVGLRPVATCQKCLAAYPASVTNEPAGLIPGRRTLWAILRTGKFQPEAEGFDEQG
jgi:hypothetical protein